MRVKAAYSYAEMKKSKLVIDYEFDFELLGIISSAKGYKLAWELNQALGIQLVKQPDLVVGFKNNEEKSFSFYAHRDTVQSFETVQKQACRTGRWKVFFNP